MWAFAFAIIVAGAFALAFRAYASPAKAEDIVTTKPTLDELFQRYGAKNGVDPMLAKAIAMRESSLNPAAIRMRPPYDVSVGLMQVLCLKPANADAGATDWVCANSRPEISGWDGLTFCALKDAETNIDISTRILAAYQSRYGFLRGIAAYNSKSARTAPDNGPFPNQGYVNAIRANYKALTGNDL